MKELRIYKITDAGPKENEDSCYVVQHSVSTALACMADGVSSQSEARHTSSFITEYVEDFYEEEGDHLFRCDAETVQKMMYDLVMDIHNDLLATADENGRCLGSTLDLAIIGKGRMFVTHVGDSRVYLYDGKNIDKITEDQTVEQAEKTTGIIYDIDEKRKAHTLLQCMGAGDVSPYQYEVAIPVTCDILLCSDGLTNKLTNHDLTTQLKKKQTGSDALLALVKLAREKGESDNITAILIRRREKPDKSQVKRTR